MRTGVVRDLDARRRSRRHDPAAELDEKRLEAGAAYLSAALLADPRELDATLDGLDRVDFATPQHAAIFAAIVALRRGGQAIDLEELKLELHLPGGVGSLVSTADLAALADVEASGVRIRQHARRVRRLALEARALQVAQQIAARGREPDLVAKLRAIEHEIEAEDGGRARGPSLDATAFSGARLLGLLGRPAPQPVEAGRPVPGHLALLVAPAITGKTSLALWAAMARAAGVAPWPGATARPAGRVLLLSLDEAPEQVVRRMNGLATFHPSGPIARFAKRISVIGPDRDVDPHVLEALRFDEAGLATLGRWLADAEAAGEPIVEAYIDAYADVLPSGETENSNEAATHVCGALERLAVRFGCAIALLHHSGKPSKTETGQALDVRFAARGASALAAKARVVFALEAVEGMPHLRRIRTATNLGPTPRPALFEVSPADADHADQLLYWKPAAEVLDRDPRDFLVPGGAPISTNDLARLLAGDTLPEDRDPPGDVKKLATTLRERWREAGLVNVIEGPRRAKLIALAEVQP